MAKKKKTADHLNTPEALARRKAIMEKRRNLEVTKNLIEAGLTQGEVAALFGMTEKGMTNKKKTDKELADTIKHAKKNLEKILTQNMITKALGYDYTETKTTSTKDKNGKWKQVKKDVTKKHCPGNSQLFIFLMTNRFGENWKMSKELISKKESYDAKPSERARKQIESLSADILKEGSEESPGELELPSGPSRISD